MGLNPGRNNRPTVSMSEKPDVQARMDDFEYVVHEDAVEGLDFVAPLGDGTSLAIRTMERGKLTVDFSLNQIVDEDFVANHDRVPADVARIDCCHSEVHRHQFYWHKKTQNREVIRDLRGERNQKSAEQAVNNCYDQSYSIMMQNWELYLERWERGNAEGN